MSSLLGMRLPTGSDATARTSWGSTQPIASTSGSGSAGALMAYETNWVSIGPVRVSSDSSRRSTRSPSPRMPRAVAACDSALRSRSDTVTSSTPPAPPETSRANIAARS